MISLAWAALGALPLVTARFLLTPSADGMGTHRQLGLPPCTFLYLSGIPCPFCGMTTSWTHAAHGQILSSIATQPAGFAFFVIDFGIVFWCLWAAAIGLPQWRPEKFLSAIPRWLWWSGLSLTCAAWIYKILVVRGFL